VAHIIHSLTGRAAGLSFALALAVLAAAPAAAQVAADLEAMVTVDNVLDSVGGALPEGGVNLISRIVPSDSYFVAVSGTTVAVSTRFLREASRDALAAAVVRALHPDPVPAAVVLFRAGFNGPAGFAELYNRVAGLVALDAAHRAAVSQGARDLRDEINRDSFLAFAREGYHLMYRAHIESVRLRYHQAIDAQRSFQAQIPGSYSMPPVPLALVQAVDEVTAVLAGARSIDSSPWGSEIRAALGAYQPTVPPPPPGPPPAAEASAPGSRQ
jgi:hypothetical protein